jgi:hypothetical protein
VQLWERYVARRNRKTRERYEQEKARQKALWNQDAQQAMRDIATGSAGAQQGMYGQS